MATSGELSFGGAIATRLIGRDDELTQIKRAVGPAAGRAFRCVLVEGSGGFGKTRLLREISELLGTRAEPTELMLPRARWGLANVVTLPLVDVAEPYLHTVVPFLREVRDGVRRVLGADADANFAEFDRVTEDYVTARDGEQPYGTVAELRNEVIAAFEAAYLELTRTRRIVWVIDTLEQLFRSRPEIEALFTEGEPIDRPREQLTSSWLSDFITRLPDQTTLILAGRPEPQRWASDVQRVIEQALAGASDPCDPREVLSQMNLGPFDARQIGEYLNALYEQLSGLPAHRTLATYLKDSLLKSPEQPEIIALLTEGNPIRLAIYIDLLLNSDTTVRAFHASLESLRQMVHTGGEQLAPLRADVDRALLRYLTENLGNPEHQVIELLALMRRGLDVERLHEIWSKDRELIERTIRNLLNLSFVKYRWKSVEHESGPERPNPTEIRIFLHDEFYSIYQRSFLSEDPDRLEERREEQRMLFDRLIAFCDHEFIHCRDAIPALQAELSQYVAGISGVEGDDGDPAASTVDLERRRLEGLSPEEQKRYRELKGILRGLRHDRRQVRTEQLHYALFNNPELAFYDRYFRRSEQAFSANAVEHDAQLQSETDLFFFGTTAENNGRQTGLSAAQWNQLRYAVVLQQVSGWIKRLTIYGRFAEAQLFATRAKERFAALAAAAYPEWLPATQQSRPGQLIAYLYQLEWEANSAFAAIFEGLRVNEAIATLERVTGRLKTALETMHGPQEREIPILRDLERLTDAQYTRFRNVVAQCLLMIGYAHATLSQFGIARRYYLQAAEAVHETGFGTLAAEIRNDLSRVLGELGDLVGAQLTCQQGLVARRARGFDYLQALSYNTMALIHSRNGLPLKANLWSEEALSLFRQLDQPRGIGLALLQVAEARRRTVSLLLADSQLLETRTSSRLTLPPRLFDRAQRDLAEAEKRLKEAAEIFSEPETGQPAGVRDRRRVPELVRRIELFTERAALYREWAALNGEAAGGEKLSLAMESLDQVIALASPKSSPEDEYARFRLAALVNKAGIYRRAKRPDLVEQTLAQADGLIDPWYKLTKGTTLNLQTDQVKEVYFRELGRMEAIRAAVELDRPTDRPEILHYMLAVTYFQLFSPYEGPYLTITRRRLANLLNRLREQRNGDDRDLRAIIEEVIVQYSLRALGDYLKQRDKEYDIGKGSTLIVQTLL